MKKHNKIIVIILVCIMCFGVFYGCEKVDISSPATIVINIDSPISASDIVVTSSAGELTNKDKQFTIALKNRRDLVISISSAGLKTVTLKFSAKDFAESASITRAVKFDEVLTSVFKLNIKTDEKVNFTVEDTSINVTNSGNKYTLIAPNRDKTKSYKYNVTGDNIEPYSGEIASKNIFNGLYFEDIFLAPKGKRIIEVETFDYYNEGILSQNYNLLLGIQKNSSVQNQGNNFLRNYIFFLDANDAVVFTNSATAEKKLIKGCNITPYNNFVKLNNSQIDANNELITQKLYVQRDYSLGIKAYAKLQDNTFIYVDVVNNGWSDNKGNPTRECFIPLSDTLELHTLQTYFKQGDGNSQTINCKRIYKFTKEEIATSKVSPLEIFDNEGVIAINKSFTETTFENRDMNIDYDSKETLSDSIDYSVYTFLDYTERIYDGSLLSNKRYYGKVFSLECNINFGDFYTSDYRIVCNDNHLSEDFFSPTSKEQKITFSKVAFDRNKLLNIQVERYYANSKNSKNMIGSEVFTFDKDDLVSIGDKAFRLKNTIILKNYIFIEVNRLSDNYDFSSVTGISPDEQGNVRVNVSSVEFELSNSDDARLIRQGYQYVFLSPNAKFKIIYTLNVQGNNFGGTIVVKGVKKEAVDGLPEVEFNVDDLLAFYDNPNLPPNSPYPFKLILVSKKIQNWNKH